MLLSSLSAGNNPVLSSVSTSVMRLGEVVGVGNHSRLVLLDARVISTFHLSDVKIIIEMALNKPGNNIATWAFGEVEV